MKMTHDAKRRAALIAVCICLCLSTAGCRARYDADDIIGKTSLEIMSEYGEFECVTMPVGEDGLYRNCRCGYTVKEARKGFLDKSEEVLFFIGFDENGVAVECEKGYRPGG